MDAISRILKDKKVVLFDFDGTLVDSMGMWGEVDKAILRSHGLPIPDNFTEEFMFPMIPLTEEETAQFFLDYGCKGTVQTILDQIEQLSQEQYEQHIEAKPGAVELVKALRDAGVKLGLVTAATIGRILPCLARNGMTGWFHYIVNCDHVGLPKTDPAIYRMALEHFGVKAEEAVFFDDNLTAIRTAKSLGIATVGVYDAHADNTWSEMQTEADATVKDFTGLCDII